MASNMLTTQQKALKINLDDSIYGTFAEIGAGQEVAANFFKAGAASGTVAKSISAYDMTFSDAIYGKEASGRYVCQARAEKMVQYEYDLLIERLQSKFPEKMFFAFANTVAARNFHGTNEPHGWLSVVFQESPDSKPSRLVVHVRMHDSTNLLQQHALGVLGVNMIHACYFQRDNSKTLVQELMNNLSPSRIEIDMVEVDGPAFKSIDNRVLNLELIVNNYTEAVMFDACGRVKLPKDELYRKNILCARGSYRPPTHVNVDILATGLKNFENDIPEDDKNTVSLAEITINHLKEDGEITYDDFLARVDLLASLGQKVLITNMPQYFRLSEYISKFKPKQMALVLGVYNFMQIFDDEYISLKGGLLEAMGSLLKTNLNIYLYPYREDSKKDELINLNNIEVASKHSALFEYVKQSGQVKDIQGYNDERLHIYSRKVLRMIMSNEKGWEKYVPAEISKVINEKCLFGHPCDTK